MTFLFLWGYEAEKKSPLISKVVEGCHSEAHQKLHPDLCFDSWAHAIDTEPSHAHPSVETSDICSRSKKGIRKMDTQECSSAHHHRKNPTARANYVVNIHVVLYTRVHRRLDLTA